MSKKSPECFALVQSITRARHKSLGSYKGWELYKEPDEGESISSEDAERLIEEYDMEEVVSTDEGRIYDMPGRPFFKKYKGYFAEQERKEREKREKMKARCAQAREKKRKEKENETEQHA